MVKPQSEAVPPQLGAEIVDRMAVAYGRKGLAELADAMGQPATTVKNWRYRGAVPIEYLLQVRRDTHRSLDWLVLGDEPTVHKRGDYAAVHRAMALHVSEPERRGWLDGEQAPVTADTTRAGGGGLNPEVTGASFGALLPVTGPSNARPLVLSVRVGEAGQQLDYEVIPKLCGGANGPSKGPSEPLQIDRAGDMAMTFEWLQRNLRHTTGQLASVLVIGDSMQPTLQDGDTIIIDRGVRELSVDAIYAVHMLGQRLVKRVQRKFDGSVVIISDNNAYERETVPRAQVGEIEVLGRMVWPRVR